MKSVFRTHLPAIIAIALLVIGLVVTLAFSAKAQNTFQNNVIGAAWASTPGTQGLGIGWVSLNGGSQYAMSINPNTGDISGQGWSEHVGWMNFDPTSGFPTTPGNWAVPATLVVSANQANFPGAALGDIVGWAKLEPLNGDPGGWDGWVSMRGYIPGGSQYGVRLAGDFSISNSGDFCSGTSGLCQFSGQAWGDMVAGWIDFQYASANLDNVLIETCNPDGTPNGVDENQNGTMDEGCNQLDYCADGIDNETPTQVPASPDGTIDNCNAYCTDGVDNEQPGQWPASPDGTIDNCATAPSPSVSVDLSPNGQVIDCNTDSATLVWTTSNATSCTATGGFGFSGSVNPNGGSDTVSGMSSISNTFSISCSGPNGPATDSVIVQCSQVVPTEICGNSQDDDADGQTDEGCPGSGPFNPDYQEI